MKKYAFLSLLAVLALGACDDDDDPTGTGGTAQVRVINATTATTGTNSFTSVGLFRGTSTQIVGGVPAGVPTSTVNASSCSSTLTVPAGSQTLFFRASTGSATNVATRTFNFVANKRYTIVLTGNNNTGLQTQIFEDETLNTPTTGNRRIRVINATTNAAAGDVFARPAGATGVPSGTANATNVASGGASAGFTVVDANTLFQLWNTGTPTGTARASVNLSATGFPANRNATIVFTDAGGFQVNACP